MVGKYDYNELRDTFLKNETEENLLNLAEWFERFGDEYWNGEKWSSDNLDIYPILKHDEAFDTWETIGYETYSVKALKEK